MYCEATTAPPVANAENSWMNRLDMLSTSDIPLTEASPTAATMIVSAMPMVMVRSCSKNSGTISDLRYDGVNILSVGAIDFIDAILSPNRECEHNVKYRRACGRKRRDAL